MIRTDNDYPEYWRESDFNVELTGRSWIETNGYFDTNTRSVVVGVCHDGELPRISLNVVGPRELNDVDACSIDDHGFQNCFMTPEQAEKVIEMLQSAILYARVNGA